MKKRNILLASALGLAAVAATVNIAMTTRPMIKKSGAASFCKVKGQPMQVGTLKREIFVKANNSTKYPEFKKYLESLGIRSTADLPNDCGSLTGYYNTAETVYKKK